MNAIYSAPFGHPVDPTGQRMPFLQQIGSGVLNFADRVLFGCLGQSGFNRRPPGDDKTLNIASVNLSNGPWVYTVVPWED
jgi:hypothetical protein